LWLLISEIYLLKNRGVGMSAVIATNWAIKLLLPLLFLTLVAVLGHAPSRMVSSQPAAHIP
jgi:hypothetical protein